MKKAPIFKFDHEIETLAERFIARTLPEAEWTHYAHWATALYLIVKRPDIAPEKDMPSLIRAFNESVGGVNSDTQGYHETITQASLMIARQFIDTQDDEPSLVEMTNRLYASELGNSHWLLKHYSKALLFSTTARREWVAPDIAALKL